MAMNVLKKLKLAINPILVFFVYNTLVLIISFFLRIISLFNSKIRLFTTGRRDVFDSLKKSIKKENKIIWIHAASLGEYEQGLPVLEKLKEDFPSHKYLLSFFSPSGYEVKKNSHIADYITYLPLDTSQNAAKFITIVNPVLAIFIKYEIWPNMLRKLDQNQIPSILFSAIFNKKQSYFRWYGGFMRRALFTFEHIFVQNQESQSLLHSIDYKRVSICGDTRFDRVSKIVTQNNHLDFAEVFKKDSLCFVIGSSWPEDEKILVPYINAVEGNVTFIIAPHNINASHINRLKGKLSKPALLLSEYSADEASKSEVLIVDSIGLLTKIYSYADVAYVGGGFATGLHNTLEPAAFGIPVVIGPKYKGFKEAEDLVKLGGIVSITSAKEFSSVANSFLSDKHKRAHIGHINSNYVANMSGASIQIASHIRKLLKNRL